MSWISENCGAGREDGRVPGMNKAQTNARYILEIYHPGSIRDGLAMFFSETPFQTISKGDILSPSLWANASDFLQPLVVVNAEHIIWETKDGLARHKLCVYTKSVEDNEASRLNP